MAANPSIQLGTDGNWAIKEDNLLAYKKDGTRFFNKEFDFTRGSLATFVDKDGLIKYSGVTDTELVVNGNFSDGTNSWTPNTNATLSIDNGKLKVAISGAASGYPSQNITTVVGRKYKITADAFIGTATKVSLYSAAFGFNDLTTDGSYNFTFTATSTSTQIRLYVYGNESYGFWDNVSIKEIQTDVPRIDFTNDTTGHLLLEPQSTNLLTYSEDFSQWTTQGTITITPSYGISPDGTKNSTRIFFSDGSQQIYKSFTSSSGVSGSIYIKGNSGEAIKFGVTGGEEVLTLNGDWQRLTTYSGSSTRLTINTYGATSTARDIQVWGAQVEEQSFATSYIPTNGSIATRNAEVCNNSGSAQDFNSQEGVLYCDIAALADDNTFRMISISDGTNDNRVRINYSATTQLIQSRVVVGGVSQAEINKFGFTGITNLTKIALSYKQDEVKFYINGELIGTDTSATMPTADTFNVLNFDGGNGSNDFYGKTKNLKVFKRAMSDEELQQLTT